MISRRWAVWIAALYFLAMTAAVTYPGIVPFNRIRPLVLGVPFVLAWYLAWVVGALIAFLLLHRSESR